MKVAVIGANGQLGQDVVAAFRGDGSEVVELNHDRIEVADPASVAVALEKAEAHLVINTAAMHHLDQCEQDPERSFRVNALGARNVALACRERGSALMYISTDYVFDGAKRAPYLENDEALPLNAYGVSKLAGEAFVRSILPQHFVLRVSGIYGHTPCRAKGHNFVQLMLKLARERAEVRVVDDEVLTPTYTGDIARQIVRLAASDAYGLYHVSAHGQCSWYEFAREIWQLAGLTTRLAVADPAEFPAKTPRPKYSVLANRALEERGLDVMRSWQEGLADYLGRAP
jgi:dTDP-4-dehydrorhamnose reductase